MSTPSGSPSTPTHRGLGIAALITGILIAGASLAAVGWTLWSAYVGGLGGFAVMIIASLGPAFGAAALVGVIVGTVGIVLSRPRRNAVIGLCLSLAPVVVLLVFLLLASLTSSPANP